MQTGLRHEGIADAVAIVGRKGEIILYGTFVHEQTAVIVVGTKPTQGGIDRQPTMPPFRLSAEHDTSAGTGRGGIATSASRQIDGIGLARKGERLRGGMVGT